VKLVAVASHRDVKNYPNLLLGVREALDNGAGVEATSEADLHPWPAPFDQPFYLVMNVAVGGNFPGVPNANTKFPAELVVDYVRVYDKVGGYGPVQPRGPGVMPWQPGHGSERRK
jgi:hypothetical protein